jgi:ferredoxin
MTLLPTVDEHACAAHGDCTEVAPDVFRVDDVARVTGTGPDDLLLAAAEACPSVAITVRDAETGDVVSPSLTGAGPTRSLARLAGAPVEQG